MRPGVRFLTALKVPNAVHIFSAEFQMSCFTNYGVNQREIKMSTRADSERCERRLIYFMCASQSLGRKSRRQAAGR